MVKLTEQQKQAIAEAIETAEKNTSGELVAVLAQSSDDYLYIPVLWASLLSLALPGIFILGELLIDPVRIYQYQVGSFILLALMFQWFPIKMSLIPPIVKRQRAALRARDEFLTLGLHNTSHRGGIMIFVSVAEHYVEILTDQSVSEKIPDQEWEQLVARFIDCIRQGDFATGYLETIKSSGEIMANHFPPGAGDNNELTNQLIEV
ncbi:MAG: TPM domain-containing protein [Gammaproteobacteria bacterium]|nr:TPM domain-containing protein [Gammaproteobacteria bacterium]